MASSHQRTPKSQAPTEAVVASSVAFAGHLLTLRVDTVRLASGRESRREIVEHPGAVVILATTPTGEVLLLEHFRLAAGRSLLELPAGLREPGETPEATARRELREETGYDTAGVTTVLSFFTSPGYSTEQLALVRATGCRQVSTEIDADEVGALQLVPQADIPALLASGGIIDAKTLVGLLWLLHGTGIEGIFPVE